MNVDYFTIISRADQGETSSPDHAMGHVTSSPGQTMGHVTSGPDQAMGHMSSQHVSIGSKQCSLTSISDEIAYMYNNTIVTIFHSRMK